MKREITDLIDRVKADCLVGKPQKRDTIIALLDLEPGSQEYAYLCRAAREAAMVITGKEVYLWGAIGVDFAPCSMNCTFCSLGEAWASSIMRSVIQRRKSFNRSGSMSAAA